MTDTPNARLARVLRLLADVAERGYYLSTEEGLGSAYLAYCPDDLNLAHLKDAESYATEAARLAGVPLDGWRTDEPPANLPDDALIVLRSNGRICIAGRILGAWHTGREIYSDHKAAVLAWRPLPEPYRPEEKTDEQR